MDGLRGVRVEACLPPLQGFVHMRLVVEAEADVVYRSGGGVYLQNSLERLLRLRVLFLRHLQEAPHLKEAGELVCAF